MALNSRLIRRCSLLSMLGAAILVGCGPSYPKVEPVSGKVTYKNQPVEGAQVSFFLDGSGTPAVGTTSADGAFELTSHRPKDGAPAGTHKVTVLKVEVSGAAVAPGESMEAAVARGPTENVEKALLPTAYSNPGQSPLSFTVEAGKKNHFDIELKD